MTKRVIWIIIGLILFNEASARTYFPVSFLVPFNKKTGIHQTVYNGNLQIAWTIRRNYIYNREVLDFQNTKYELIVTNIFDDVLKVYETKDTTLVIKQLDLPVTESAFLIKLITTVPNKITGELELLECGSLLVKQSLTPDDALDSLLSLEINQENSNRITLAYLQRDFFLNALYFYYSNYEYRTVEYDRFFDKYLYAIGYKKDYNVEYADNWPTITLKTETYKVKEIMLDKSKFELPKPKIRIDRIVDNRRDTTNIGIVHVSVFNIPRVANLHNGVSAEFYRVLSEFDSSLRSEVSIVIYINQLSISEIILFTKEFAILKFEYEVKVVKNAREISLFTIKDVIDKKGIETTKWHRINILKSIEMMINGINAMDVDSKLGLL